MIIEGPGSPQVDSHCNRAPLGCGGRGGIMDVQLIWSQYGSNSVRNVSSTVLNLCHKIVCQF